MISNEIKILRKLKHPNIVRLHEVYELETQIVLVMEYIHGERLFDYIVKSGKLTETKSATIMKQLFCVLSYFEVQGVIHRDIKPENILVVLDEYQRPNIKVIDFGLGTFHFQRDIIKKCGTAGYTAPEIINNEPYDFRADLYSAGIVMFVL